MYRANAIFDLNLCVLQLSLITKEKPDGTVLPPKLRLSFFFIPEFKSSSSSPSWEGDRTPPSQPIMAGTFSSKNCGNTPVDTAKYLLLKHYSVDCHKDELQVTCLRSYQSCGRSLWSSARWLPVAWGVSLCERSFSLYRLLSEGCWEPGLQTSYCYPSYSLHSWD